MDMESKFILKPDLDFFEYTKKGIFGERDRYGVVLEDTLLYYSKLLDRRLLVPSGFQSDGASVPQIFWSIYPPFGRYLYAAILHDYFYYLGRKDASFISKEDADLLFKEAMIVLGVSEFSAQTMYLAVKTFGYRFERDDENTIII